VSEALSFFPLDGILFLVPFLDRRYVREKEGREETYHFIMAT